jgi:hypothetical protein
MTDEFLTKGLQDDRYLKALRLVDEFEDKLEATLRGFGQRMVAEHPELFGVNPDGNERTNRNPGSALAHTRVHYPMTGEQAPEADQTWGLNVHLYWVRPEQYERTDVDGALRAFGYKIKYADRDIDDRVVEQTRARDLPVETAENPYDSNIAFYSHVSSVAEIEETADILVDHFSEFGDKYATPQDE